MRAAGDVVTLVRRQIGIVAEIQFGAVQLRVVQHRAKKAGQLFMPGPPRRVRAQQQALEPFQGPDVAGIGERLLAVEVIVERGVAQVEAGRDLRHGRERVGLLVDDLDGGADDRVALARRLATARQGRGRRPLRVRALLLRQDRRILIRCCCARPTGSPRGRNVVHVSSLH